MDNSVGMGPEAIFLYGNFGGERGVAAACKRVTLGGVMWTWCGGLGCGIVGVMKSTITHVVRTQERARDGRHLTVLHTFELRANVPLMTSGAVLTLGVAEEGTELDLEVTSSRFHVESGWQEIETRAVLLSETALDHEDEMMQMSSRHYARAVATMGEARHEVLGSGDVWTEEDLARSCARSRSAYV